LDVEVLKLFGSSGVRGVVNLELNPMLLAKIGVAVVTYSKAKKIIIGRDTRVSGLVFENALVSGLLAGGANVNCLGIVPTPVLAYLTKKLKFDVGLMVTASHNPPNYNGIKIFNNDGMSYDEKSQTEIEKIIEQEEFEWTNWRNIGKAQFLDEGHQYIKMVQKKAKFDQEWYVVVDPGCGATYKTALEVFKKLKCKMMAINAQPDGFFPSRSPEPNAETLEPLAKIVHELGADAGIAYDGDGDRVAFVDEKGNFVDFDQLLAAYAGYVTKRTKGGTIVTNVEASMCIEEMVEQHGGKIIRTKVGDVYIAEAIRQSKAVFGGEPCGAWIHPHINYCPDGILTSVLLLKALETENMKLSEFISKVPVFEVLRENISCQNDKKYEVVENAKARLKSIFPEYKQFSTVDGIRLTLNDGWVLIRASGTEPLIRVTVEGKSLKIANKIMERVKTLVRIILEEFEI
jgi:phosphoglucosamine mutase